MSARKMHNRVAQTTSDALNERGDERGDLTLQQRRDFSCGTEQPRLQRRNPTMPPLQRALVFLVCFFSPRLAD